MRYGIPPKVPPAQPSPQQIEQGKRLAMELGLDEQRTDKLCWLIAQAREEELKPLYYCGNCAHWQDAMGYYNINYIDREYQLVKECPVNKRHCLTDDYCTSHKEIK